MRSEVEASRVVPHTFAPIASSPTTLLFSQLVLLPPIAERERQSFELHRHVDRSNGDVGRNRNLNRREIKYRLDAGAHDLLHDRRCALGGRGDHRDVELVLRGVLFQL